MIDVSQCSLLEAIPRLSPQMRSPFHLTDLCDQFERIRCGEPVRVLCAEPIRHWKTQTMLHGIAWLLAAEPSARYLLLTHSHERASWLGKGLRDLAEAAGVGPVRGQNTIVDWSNEHGGGAIVMSAEQSKLGHDVHGVFADDPMDENASQDHARREVVDEKIELYTSRCMRGGKPGPVLIVASPWHPDDPIGRRRQRTATHWEYLTHPVIMHEGTPEERAFAPDVWDLPALKQMRAEMREVDPTERIWWAQLMCNPKPVGMSKFRGDPERWTTLPEWSFRQAYGVDLAFTSGEGSDYFALVVGKVYGTKLYILDVQRTKLDAHLIESTCRAAMSKYGHAPFYSYVSGPEIGTVKIMRERGLPFIPMRARYNKLVRAERTIKRWNDLQIVVPHEAPWLPGFMHRVEMFRGDDKGHDDDEIDALVSLADGALGGAVAGGGVKVLGPAYRGMA